MKDLPVPRGEYETELIGSFERRTCELNLPSLVSDGSSPGATIVSCSRELTGALGFDPVAKGARLDDVFDRLPVPLRGAFKSELKRESGQPLFVQVLPQRLRPAGHWAWVVCESALDPMTPETLVHLLAHEINNPLTSVLWKLELVARQLPRVAHDPTRLAELGRHLDDAQSGTKRVVELVKGFNQSLRCQPVDCEPVDLVEVVREAVCLVRSEIEQVATLVEEFELVPMVDGHRLRLLQVFSNLLLNALQAVREATVPQDHRIRVFVHVNGSWVVASVDDTGVGVSDSLKRRVFEPFMTTRAKSGGSGLGLFISREIVESLGGRLQVESSGMTGASFRVYLPVNDPVSGPVAGPPVSYRRATRR